MAARVKKIRHDEETRSKIKAAQIINRFQNCVNGDLELNAQQVSCGKALLDKVLPDLKAMDFEGSLAHDVSDPLKDFLASVHNSGKRIGG